MLKANFYRWLFIAILLGMQYITLHHAIEHLFHVSDVSCTIFATVEHQSDSLIQSVFNFHLILNNQIIIFFDYILLTSLVFQSFQARAPPL